LRSVILTRREQSAAQCCYFSHATDEFDRAGARTIEGIYRKQGIVLRMRGRADPGALPGRVDLVEPGLVEVQHWRPAAGAGPDPGKHLDCLGAIGIKPAA
jgi:hypothetical protein